MSWWRKWYEFSNRNWWQIMFIYWLLLAGLIAIIITGCGGDPRPLPNAPAGNAGAALGQLGTTLTWVGGISAAAGIAGGILSLAFPALILLRPIFGVLGWAGSAVTATGTSVLWLSDHPWIMVVAVGASLGVVVWWYYPRIRRALDRRLGNKP
jgi:hypothetical protein